MFRALCSLCQVFPRGQYWVPIYLDTITQIPLSLGSFVLMISSYIVLFTIKRILFIFNLI